MTTSNKCPPEICSVEEKIKKVDLNNKSGKGGTVIDQDVTTTNGVSPITSSLKREDYLTWDEYFMASAFLSSMRSKDPHTQVGAVIVNPQNRIVGVGYNGMPTGCSDDTLPWGKTSSGLITNVSKGFFWIKFICNFITCRDTVRCRFTWTPSIVSKKIYEFRRLGHCRCR